MKKANFLLLTISLLIFINLNVKAQINLTGTSYTETFDSITNGFPVGWIVKLHATATSLGSDTILTTTKTRWNSTIRGAYNYASADGLTATSDTAAQSNSTDRVLGFRQLSTIGYPGVAFTMQIANTTDRNLFIMSFKMQSLDVSSPRTTTWKVQYATGTAPTTFTDVNTTPIIINTGGSAWTNTNVTVDFGDLLDNQSLPVWIRMVTLSTSTGSGNRPTSAIDDVNLTWTNAIMNTSPIVSTTNAFNITQNFAICGGNILSNGSSLITERGICYGTSLNPDITGNKVIAAGTSLGNFSCNIYGLTPNTVYHYRAYAINGVGISYGNDSTFITDTAFTQGVIWASNMSNNTQWTVSNAPDATLATQWVRLADTSLASPLWKQYVGLNMYSSSPTNGVCYFDGITNLVNGIYGVENSILTNSIPISTLGHTSITLKFYQLYKGFNADSTLLEISSDNVNWHTIDVNPTITANQYAYGWKEYNISPWAANKAQVWIRFRFYAPSTYGSGPQYGGGYGWMIDDVSIEDTPQNSLKIDKLWVYDGYTQIPLEQNTPFRLEARVINNGVLSQTNVKLKAKELTTSTIYSNTVSYILPTTTTDTIELDSITLPNVAGDYFIAPYIISDSINQVLHNDTFKITLNNNHLFSRDNNYYYTNRYINGYQGIIANLFEVKQQCIANSVNFVVNFTTTVNSNVKTVLYRGNGQNKTLIAESAYYTLTANDIPSNSGLNPPSITLPFVNSVILSPDSVYWAGVQMLGGSDIVRIAVDNTAPLQNYNTSMYFYPATNTWNFWSMDQIYPSMIRLNTCNSPPVKTGPINGLSTVCQGQTNVIYTIAPITEATSYSWTLPSGATGTVASNTISVNFGMNAFSGYVTATGINACGSTDTSFFVTVNPLPSNNSNINGLSNICNGQSNVLYSLNQSIQNATSYLWTLPYGVSGSSITDSIYLNFGSNAQSGNITVKGQNACGYSAPVSIYVNTSQSAPDSVLYINGLSSVCNGQTAVYYSLPSVANATSYIWTLPTGVTGTSTTNSIYVNYGASAISGNITVKAHNACGDGLPKSLAVTLSPLPSNADVITGLSTVCQGQNSVTYTVPVIANATSYNWTLPYGATGTSYTNSITVSFGTNASTGNIVVQGSNVCGMGNSSSLPIIIDLLPSNAGIITGSTNLCQGSSNITYSCSNISNASSYIWTLPGGFTGISNTNSINVSTSANAISGLVKVKGSNSCGEGSESQLLVNVNPLPASNIIGQINTQPYQTETYSVTSQSGCTYNWTVNNGNILNGQGTNVLTVQWGNYGNGQVNITVTQIATYCSSSAQTNVNIGGNLPNAAGVITGLSQVCQGQTNVVYSVPVIQNATSYIWQKPNGSFDTTITNSIYINFAINAQSGIITVKGHNALGDGIASSFNIIVNPIPITPVITISGNDLYSNAVNGNQWYNLTTGIISNANTQRPI